MNEIRKKTFYILLGIIIVLFWTVLILQLAGVLSWYFPQKVMSIFSTISEISLYFIIVVLILNLIFTYVIRKYRERYEDRFIKVILSSIYCLLAFTIISVNVFIFVWVIAVGLTAILFLFSIFDLFPVKEK